MHLYTTNIPFTDIVATTPGSVAYGADGAILIQQNHYLGVVKGKITADNAVVKESSGEILVCARVLTVNPRALKPGQAIKFNSPQEEFSWAFVVSVQPSIRNEQDVTIRFLDVHNTLHSGDIAEELFVAVVPELKDVIPASMRKKAFDETLVTIKRITEFSSPWAEKAVYKLVDQSKLLGLERTNQLLDLLVLKACIQ